MPRGSRSLRRVVTAACLLQAGLIPIVSLADAFDWASETSGEFFDPAMWSPTGVPGAADTAVFDFAAPTLSPFTVTFGDPATNLGATMHRVSMALDLSGIYQYTLTSETGMDSLRLAPDPTDAATVTVRNGAVAAFGSVVLAGGYNSENRSVAELRITGTQSQPTTFTQGDDSVFDSNFVIGAAGTATLNIDGFASVVIRDHLLSNGATSSAWVVLGNESTGEGTMNITGPDASFTLEHAPMLVGQAGLGAVNVTEGARLVIGDGELWAAVGVGSTGHVNVGGVGSSLNETSGYASVIGSGGNGTLNVYDGGLASFSILDVGGEGGDDQHIGTGSVIIETGGMVESGMAAIAPGRTDSAYSIGSVRVISGTASNGSASTWNIPGALGIGGTVDNRGGRGSLAIEGDSAFVRVGYGGDNRLVVWGDGDAVDDDGLLTVDYGRLVIGGEVFADPGVALVETPGVLDLRGGTVRTYGAFDDSGLGRVYVQGHLSGHGVIDSHVMVGSGNWTNDSSLNLDVTGQATVGGDGLTGTMNVSGPGSQVCVLGRGGSLSVVGMELGSNDGSGGVMIDTGGSMYVDWALVIGGNGIGRGDLYLKDAGSQLTVGHDLTIGRETAGYIEVSGGAQLHQTTLNNSAPIFTIGGGGGGSALITGVNTYADVQRLDVSDRASGDLTIDDSAMVDVAGQLLMGRNGAAGTLTVRGGATLQTRYGGSLSHSSGIVASGTGPLGDMHEWSQVSVDGGTWNQDGVLGVGFRDGTRGRVTVSNGGRITSAHGAIGRTVGSEGEMTVTGVGSTWDLLGGEIGVGGIPAAGNFAGGVNLGTDDAGGTGRLTIADGGVVTASRVVVFPGGSVTLAGGTLDAPVSVQGLLAGSGDIGGSVSIEAAGTLSPGLSPGTLSIFGDLNLAGLTIMEIDGLDPAQHDTVSGMGSIAYGGSLELHFAGAYANGDTIGLFQFIGHSDTQFSEIREYGLATGQSVMFDPASGAAIVIPEPAMLVLISPTLLLRSRRRISRSDRAS